MHKVHYDIIFICRAMLKIEDFLVFIPKYIFFPKHVLFLFLRIIGDFLEFFFFCFYLSFPFVYFVIFSIILFSKISGYDLLISGIYCKEKFSSRYRRIISFFMVSKRLVPKYL